MIQTPPSSVLARRQLLLRSVQVAALCGAAKLGLSNALVSPPQAPRLSALGAGGPHALRVVVPSLQGTPAFPLWCAERLGFFGRQGASVALLDEASDDMALRRLQRGEADLALVGLSSLITNALGAASHWRVVLQLWRTPQTVLMVSRRAVARYLAPGQLSGLRIGVGTSGIAGGHTALMALKTGGVPANGVSWVNVGSWEGALTAMAKLQVDALVAQDPVVNLLERDFSMQIAADTRSQSGTRALFGHDYPGLCLVARTPWLSANLAQVHAAVLAITRAMKWLQTAQAGDWAKVLPELPSLGQRSDYILAWEKGRAALSSSALPREDDVSAVMRVMKGLHLKPTFESNWRQVMAPEFVERALSQT